MKAYLIGALNINNNKKFSNLFLDQKSLLWNRDYAEDNVNCNEIYQSLKLLKDV